MCSVTCLYIILDVLPMSSKSFISSSMKRLTVGFYPHMMNNDFALDIVTNDNVNAYKH